MANRYKKNGPTETVIEGKYRRRFKDDDPLETHRRRYYSDPKYRERYGGEQPARPVQKRFNYTVPLDPKDAERLRKLAKEEKLQKTIARNLFRATRVINPVLKWKSIYDTFEPILKDLDFSSPYWGIAPYVPGVVIEGTQRGDFVLKCASPGVRPIDTFGVFNGNNNPNSCGLSGQASPGGFMNFTADTVLMTGSHVPRTWIWSRGYLIGGSVQRRQYATIMWELAGSGGVLNGTTMRKWNSTMAPDFLAGMNPNVLREMPGQAAASPRDFMSPVDRYIDALDNTPRALSRGAVVVRGGGPGGGGPTISPAKPGPPSPPGRGRRERKGVSTMRTVLSMLDTLSEAAEVVDAVFEALPKKVQRKWKCNRKGFIDAAGQYGIDNADCKIKAIFWNIHKIDMEQAVKNIIANEIQDRVIGGIARASPVNVGRATDEGQKAVNELLERLFQEVGLKPDEERN